MTRNDFVIIVLNAIYDDHWGERSQEEDIDVLLAAFDENNIVIGTRATYTSDIDMRPINEHDLVLVEVIK